MTKLPNLHELFRSRRRFDRTEISVEATAFFKNGTSTPCLVHDISENETNNSIGMRVELIGYGDSDPPDEYYIYFEQSGHFIKHKPVWRQRL